MNLVDELYAVAAALREAGVRYAICGGLAVTIHGATRTTKDIDILVPPDRVDDALEAVRPLGYRFAALPTTFDVGKPGERRVQRVTKVDGDDHLVLDLIFEDAAFRRMLDGCIEIDLPEGQLSVVSLEALGAMKRLAGRPQDLADLQHLASPSMLRTMRDMSPGAVAARLELVRATWVPLDAAEARRRMSAPSAPTDLARGAERRLSELRALDDLTRHLHRAKLPA